MILSKTYIVNEGDKIPLYRCKKAMLRAISSYIRIVIGDSEYIILPQFHVFEFPIINGKSPNFATIIKSGNEKESLTVSIYELGGVPSDDYGKEVN